MSAPGVPTRSPLRAEVPTIEAFEALQAEVDALRARVDALEGGEDEPVLPSLSLFPGSALYPKAS